MWPQKIWGQKMCGSVETLASHKIWGFESHIGVSWGPKNLRFGEFLAVSLTLLEIFLVLYIPPNTLLDVI